MTATPDAYLETQVLTATPQRLRLMLIEAAIRQARLAASEDEAVPGQRDEAIGRCREIVAELIGGIQPDRSPVAKQALGIYLFVFSALTESRLSGDRGRLRDVVRVLEEDRQTWQEVCSRFPDRLAAENVTAHPAEELAPQHVAGIRTGNYGSGPNALPAALSLEA